jgi:hypothetical protein
MTGTVSEFDDVMVGQNVTFDSNRDFEVSTVAFSPGEYVNNFTFTSSNTVTNMTWTWVTQSDYMYFYYPNMSVDPEPFGFPTLRPSFAPSDDDDDDDDDDAQCSDSPCPTHCANGYTDGYTMNGCTVYCKDKPTNGQCAPGGSGCNSSCRSISVAAIIGIVVGGVSFIALVVGMSIYFYCNRVRKPMTQRENEAANAL